jgi:hypothetical protein
MIKNGIPINIVFVDDGHSLTTTSYCGSLAMFDKANMPDFITNVNIGDQISVSIHRADMSKLLNYIREFGTSMVKQF